jgi:AcrR family transcriptional regulator
LSPRACRKSSHRTPDFAEKKIVSNQSKSSTEHRLVEAAVQLFSRQGYSATSTREVALVADVNEASLFRHFSKEDLFWAALQSRLKQVRLRKELQEGLSTVEKPERVVPLILEFVVFTAVRQADLIRLLHVGFLELRPGTERLYRQYFAPVSCAIHEYLDRSRKNGWIRDLDHSITTMAFIATILAHPSMYPLAAEAGPLCENAEKATAAYSEYWLGTLLPDDRKVSAPKPSVRNCALILEEQ